MLDAAVTVQGNIKGSPTSSLIARRGRLPAILPAIQFLPVIQLLPAIPLLPAILPRYRCAWVAPSLPT